MGRAPSSKTPQFKTAVVRKLKNIAPGYEVEFIDSSRGVAFRLKDAKGRYRSRIVALRSNKDGHALDRSELVGLLEAAGFPAVVPD